jgi:hypothetical protein
MVWVYGFLCLTGYGVTFPFLFTQYNMFTINDVLTRNWDFSQVLSLFQCQKMDHQQEAADHWTGCQPSASADAAGNRSWLETEGAQRCRGASN